MGFCQATFRRMEFAVPECVVKQVLDSTAGVQKHRRQGRRRENTGGVSATDYNSRMAP
jgi:S1-C subfamily serine protease